MNYVTFRTIEIDKTYLFKRKYGLLVLALAKELSDGLLVGTTRNHHNNKIFLHAYQQ